jgi:hypothetical protein
MRKLEAIYRAKGDDGLTGRSMPEERRPGRVAATREGRILPGRRRSGTIDLRVIRREAFRLLR